MPSNELRVVDEERQRGLRKVKSEGRLNRIVKLSHEHLVDELEGTGLCGARECSKSRLQTPRHSNRCDRKNPCLVGGGANERCCSVSISQLRRSSEHHCPPSRTSEYSPSQRFIKCDACPDCIDRCADPQCRKCSIKLQHVRLEKDSDGFRKVFSICEVKRRRTADSLWVCANNLVYDATAILPWHPGGAKLLISKVGFDATADYNFHSARARKDLWDSLVIGRVTACPTGCPSYIPPKTKTPLNNCAIM